MTIQLNGEPHDCAAESTLASLLQTLNLRSQFVAVEVNQQLIPRAEHSSYVIQPLDRIEIVTLVGGG